MGRGPWECCRCAVRSRRAPRFRARLRRRRIAQAARGDRGFPKDGDAEAVRKRLNTLGADPDMHEALDDAELGWSSF